MLLHSQNSPLGPKKTINKLGHAQPKLGTSFSFLGPLEFVFSLRRGGLIRMSCPSLGPLLDWSVIDFVIFQKERFEIKNYNLSNTTNLILLDSPLQEFNAGAMHVFSS